MIALFLILNNLFIHLSSDTVDDSPQRNNINYLLKKIPNYSEFYFLFNVFFTFSENNF